LPLDLSPANGRKPALTCRYSGGGRMPRIGPNLPFLRRRINRLGKVGKLSFILTPLTGRGAPAKDGAQAKVHDSW